MTKIERLQKATRDLHGCDSQPIAPIPVHEMFEEETAWESNVELFLLLYHPRAKEAFARSYQTDAQQTRYGAVLATPPIITAREIGRVAELIEETRKLLERSRQLGEENNKLRAQFQKTADEFLTFRQKSRY